MDESAVDMINKAIALLAEAEDAARGATLPERDQKQVTVWLSLVQTYVRRVRRARQETWRRLALDEVVRYTDSVKHLIALRAAGAEADAP